MYEKSREKSLTIYGLTSNQFVNNNKVKIVKLFWDQCR